jgi:hypothetical protein
MQEPILQYGEHHEFVALGEQHMVPFPAPDDLYGRRVQYLLAVDTESISSRCAVGVTADAGDRQIV